MKIKVERSGGFAGISLSYEIDDKNLPSDMIATARKFLSDQSKSRPKRKVAPANSADRFTYRISIEDGIYHKVVECAEIDIMGDLKLLVEFMEKNSSKHK